MVTSSVSWKGAQAAIPFAALSATSGAGAANRLLWKGYLYDADLGCYCLGKRHYDPFALRFLESDDIAYLDPSVPAGVNPHAYCLNDPITYADATGHFPILAGLLSFIPYFGGAIGAFFGSAYTDLIDGQWNWQSVGWSVLQGAVINTISMLSTTIGGGAGSSWSANIGLNVVMGFPVSGISFTLDMLRYYVWTSEEEKERRRRPKAILVLPWKA